MKARRCSAEMLPAVMGLLCAFVAFLRAELLNATVGSSLLIPCKLPVPLQLQWFYWQEDGTDNTLIHCNESCDPPYKNYSVTAFESEFISGNISIMLHGVTAANDRRSFWAFARYTDGAKMVKTCEHCCNATLQVSGPYRDLNLTTDAADTATCTARGGYPQSSVSWCGRNKAYGQYVDLHGAETTHKKNPTDGTFTVTSSISVKELVSVTCRVVGLRFNKSISRSLQMDRGAAGANLSFLAILILPIIIISIVGAMGYFIYRKCHKSGTGAGGELNGGGGNDADERHELQEQHQRNTNQDNEEESCLGAEDKEEEDGPAGAAQPDRSSTSTPRRRRSPRTSDDGVTD